MSEPRILLWDIETTHNIVAAFQLYEYTASHKDILQERYIVCASWKWLGEKRIHAVSTLDNAARYAKRPHDDRHVIKTLHDTLSEADVIVAHNGDKFDLRYLNARVIFHGFKPLPPIRTIDTLKVARRKFNFNSNRLDYLGHYLGVKGKVHTSPGLWLKVLQGNRAAIREMVKYNKRDVELLEQVFYKMRPFMPNYVNRALYGLTGCTFCGSSRLISNGIRATATKAYRRLQCLDCGGWMQERESQPGKVRLKAA